MFSSVGIRMLSVGISALYCQGWTTSAKLNFLPAPVPQAPTVPPVLPKPAPLPRPSDLMPNVLAPKTTVVCLQGARNLLLLLAARLTHFAQTVIFCAAILT